MKTVNASMRKSSLILIVSLFSIGFSSILGTVQAESTIGKPAAPEFTIKFVDRSYNVAPSQTTDTYTGKTEIRPSYHVEQIDIDVTIKNQNFPCGLMYNIRIKGHFGENWYQWSINNNGDFWQSEDQYTVVTIPYYSYIYDWQDGAKVDFQVRASYGYREWTNDGYVPGVVGGSWRFVGERSDWSKTQTLTITHNSEIFNQPTNQWTDSIWTVLSIISVIVIVVVLVTVILLKRYYQAGYRCFEDSVFTAGNNC
ncbi:MAG: hypothetical protein FWH37_04380 [Candidatus Bathyarchaeota archaeon]|nr:hypothetical protein [Candidatus Termiticorpusculum sp.]